MNFQNSHKLFLLHSFPFTLFTPEDLKRMISNLHPIQFSDRGYQIGHWRSTLTCLSLPKARSCARCQGYRRKCESMSTFRELPLKMKEVDIEEVNKHKMFSESEKYDTNGGLLLCGIVLLSMGPLLAQMIKNTCLQCGSPRFDS